MTVPQNKSASHQFRLTLWISALAPLPVLLFACHVIKEHLAFLLTFLASMLALHVARLNARQEQERFAALQASEERFQAARDGSLDAFFLLQSLRDEHGKIEDFVFVDVNTRAEALLLRSREEVIGKRLCEILPFNRTRGFFNKYVHVAENGEQLQEEFEIPAEGIDASWLQHQVVRVGDGIAITSRDISQNKAIDRQLIDQQVELIQINDRMEQHIKLIDEQKVELEMQKLELVKANERLAALATTDGLTGLKNHRTFQEKLVEECERSYRNGKPVSLLLIDVDEFKKFNDQFGHPSGDRVLMQVAEILQNTARATDFVARYGGEEFAIILPYTDVQGAMGCGKRICAAIAACPWEQRRVTVSIGATTLHATTQSPITLIAEADQALYVSKSTGRNRVTLYQAEGTLTRL